MDERELSLAVVGIDYANSDEAKSNRRFEIALLEPGDPVELRREPKNPHDSNAVAVFSPSGIQIGYLTAERAPWIGGRMDAGEPVTAVFQEARPDVAWIRARFGREAPTLPPPSAPREQRRDGDRFPDFEADPDGPEWGA